VTGDPPPRIRTLPRSVWRWPQESRLFCRRSAAKVPLAPTAQRWSNPPHVVLGAPTSSPDGKRPEKHQLMFSLPDLCANGILIVVYYQGLVRSHQRSSSLRDTTDLTLRV